MSTAVICLILIVLAVLGVRSYIKRLASGCCQTGSGKQAKRIKVADRDKDNYPYHKILRIDGMVCGNCAVNVENALNRQEGVWARVNLEAGEADVYLKKDMGDQELKDLVREAGYILFGINTVQKN
ncbi:heavy metal-associated domain-containing protein [Clostridium sp. AM58-1XD]|uniref:heavy-metal-associated domain-containing protein n=1 Tax=Clostridium sp. AM58-1XD TaxID=2292307 RepID=UPI000E4A48DC|nr:heavy metal-associated domain-containing protein [Clostridium sp. AM58-1XD]RGY99595.1 heavy-metal-associated domain-containing protein [Clostridium sp. AM58-1XD]